MRAPISGSVQRQLLVEEEGCSESVEQWGKVGRVLKGESMPVPSKDDSILKLKNDKAFWAFVQALPKD
jgi:hypothetical protein